MTNEIIERPDSSDLVELLHSGEAVAVPLPFEDEEIFLYGTDVAGTNHITEIEELAAGLDLGERVELIREPDNPYDEYAIRIDTAEGCKIGYIPRMYNRIIARLMDAGFELFGKIRVNELNDSYRHIVVKVYMKQQ